ncbi:MAG: DUF11 domain-containing protein, partial [Caldisericaceae bacterium]|nr:DUF11 domain-containing protein [Caldisericaceae bacterium]
MNNYHKKAISLLLSFLLVLLSLATPFFGGVRTAKAGNPPSISVEGGTSSQTHVNNAAVYKITLTNNCDDAETFDLSAGGTSNGWTAEIFDSSNANQISQTPQIDPGETYVFYARITPESKVCDGMQDNTTITVSPQSGNCGSSSVTLTTTAINGGTLVLTKSVSPSDAKVGDTVTWTIHIKNTGNDPIGDVTITDTLGAGCSYNSDIDFHGHNPESGTYPDWAYNEIQPGADYEVTFSSTVTGCSDIDNSISGKWGINECQNVSTLASVKFVPTTPDIDYTISDISVPYCGSASIDIPITNSGNGNADNFKLKIDKIPDFYSISNIGSDWSYDSNTGEFSYNGGSSAGSIAPNETVHLTFTVSMPYGHCDTVQGSATLKYTAEYQSSCGDSFYNPSKIGNILVIGKAPHFDLEKTGPRSVDIGQTGLTYT